MKKAFGVFEILVVLVIIIVVYFACFHSQYGRKDPFADSIDVDIKTEMINDKIQEIDNAKELRHTIEQNLKKGY